MTTAPRLYRTTTKPRLLNDLNAEKKKSSAVLLYNSVLNVFALNGHCNMQYCTELVGPKKGAAIGESQWTIVTIVQTPPTCLASQKVYEAPRSHAHKIVSSHFRATPRPSRLAECDPGPCAQHASHMYLYTFRLFRRGFFFLPWQGSVSQLNFLHDHTQPHLMTHDSR